MPRTFYDILLATALNTWRLTNTAGIGSPYSQMHFLELKENVYLDFNFTEMCS